MKIFKWILILASLALAATAFVWFRDNKMPNIGKRYILYVTPGMSSAQVRDSLLKNGIIRSASSLDRCFKSEDLTANLKVGRYQLDSGMTSRYVCRMLSHAWETPTKIVVENYNTRSLGRLAKKISSTLLADSATVAKALTDDEFLKKYGVTSTTVTSLIIPDTYIVYWTADMDRIFSKFAAERDKFWNDDRKAKAEALGLSPLEVSILASIVSEETRRVEDYPKIASVYLNRLRKGMKLQACPTVAYLYDYKLSQILHKHLQTASPYNTYLNSGLPPGPICSPTRECLDAVLNPDSNKYLYFCASPDFDGTHRFATTYTEHMRNSRAYSAALQKRQKEKAAAEKAAK
ncbi:MAG: endolytic transglycosylase MltG [Bacteroidales bacterium]|nr:endolytic transglycosylase MltG [Bacteroidales bacterium]